MGGFGAMLGLGGGIVAVPALISIARFTQHRAHATSAAAVLISSMTGAISYWENGNHQDSVNIPAALLLASGGMLTSGLGAKVAGKMSSALLKKSLGYFVLISSPLILLRSYFGPKLDEVEKKESSSFSSVSKFEVAQFLTLGACSGFISGMFGVGGGIIMVPLLSLILEHQQALGTSMTAMILPCLMGTMTHWKMGNVVVSILPSMMIGAGLGSYLGAKYSTKLEETQQRAICAVAFTALSFRYLGWVPKLNLNTLPLLRALKPSH